MTETRWRRYVLANNNRPLRVYVAGPYRAETVEAREANITRARLAGRSLRQMGFHVFIPHCNAAHEDGHAPDAHFLEEALAFMRLCDAVIVLPGWEASAGTRAEMEEAERLGIPVMHLGEVT